VESREDAVEGQVYEREALAGRDGDLERRLLRFTERISRPSLHPRGAVSVEEVAYGDEARS
jgi:hypothetical protein